MITHLTRMLLQQHFPFLRQDTTRNLVQQCQVGLYAYDMLQRRAGRIFISRARSVRTSFGISPFQSHRNNLQLGRRRCTISAKYESKRPNMNSTRSTAATQNEPTRLRYQEPESSVLSQRQQASHESASESKLVEVNLEDGRIVTEAGFAVLEGVSSSFFARKDVGMQTALVLGLKSNQKVSLLDQHLGKLQCHRFLACSRIKLWWMTPEWGSSAADVPPETQFLLLQLGKGGPYAVILPLIDSGRFRGTLRPPGKGRRDGLELRVESGDESVSASKWESTVLVAAGYEPFQLADLAVAAAARLSGGAKARVDKVAPKMMDYLGWCTWDAFYSTISAEGIQQGLQSLKEGGVSPKFLIIDDGWQQTGPDSLGSKKSATRLEAKKNTLNLVGAGGHYPTNRLQSDEEDSRVANSYVTSLLENLKGRGEAVAELGIFALYKLLVENAPEDSRRVKFFTQLAKGPLKEILLAYYALTSDHTQRLQGVRANGKFSSMKATPDTPMSLPDDLKSIVQNAKEEFGVKFVYAWHSLHGYWAGVAVGNTPAMPYGAQLVLPKPTPGVLEIDPCFAWQQQVMAGVGVAPDVHALYRDMHTYLKGAGLDGVKVDCQAILGMVGGGSPAQGGGPAMSAEYHAAMERSVANHFPGNNCINCMCHSTEDIYRMENTVVARSSDDFWPQDPASHTTHVGVNAYNSMFMGAVVQPDWDMFHSRHPAALLHATARVISGGPVYISDKPGHHDFQLLKRLVLADGTLLRCSQVGRPTLDTLFDDVMRDGKSLLKVWNLNACTSVVAAFNLQGASWSRHHRRFVLHDHSPPTLSASVSPADVAIYQGLPRSTRFAIYSDSTHKLRTMASYEGIQCELDASKSDIFTLVPIQKTSFASFAPIGLTNMLNSGGAILEWATGNSPNRSLQVKVRGAGSFLAYCDTKPSQCTVNGQPVNFEHRGAGELSMVLPNNINEILVAF